MVLDSVPSLPTGRGNKSIPQEALTIFKIYENDVPKGSDMSEFLDFKYPREEVPVPRMAFLSDEETSKKTGKKKKLLEYIDNQNVPQRGVETGAPVIKINTKGEYIGNLSEPQRGGETEAPAMKMQSNGDLIPIPGAMTGITVDEEQKEGEPT